MGGKTESSRDRSDSVVNQQKREKDMAIVEKLHAKSNDYDVTDPSTGLI